MILDIVGCRPISTWKRVLNPGGTYVAAGGSISKIAETVLLGSLISATSSKTMTMLAVRPNKEDLRLLLDLVLAGTVKPSIDRRYSLEQVPEAIRYLGDGRSKGKIVITV